MSSPDDQNAAPQYPESGSRPPQQAGQAPREPYQPPGQGYPPPTQAYPAPEPYQPPGQGYPPPTQAYPAPEPYQPPGQGYPPPTQAYPAPEPYQPAQPPPYQAPAGAADAERNLARKRVEARRGLGGHVVAYVVVNLFLIVVWAFSGGGYFWPIWVLAGWGIGLVLNVWDVLFRRPITEDDIERELRRGRGGR